MKCERHFAQVRLYGMSEDQIAAFQNGARCAICRDAATVVDHCHTSGTVRGFLCQLCNKSLGAMRDSPKILRAAADYLERSK